MYDRSVLMSGETQNILTSPYYYLMVIGGCITFVFLDTSTKKAPVGSLFDKENLILC
jgi:hypothetical protein